MNTISIDEKGNKWIGTHSNYLVKFDGTNWTVYDDSNSGMPNDNVFSFAIDHSGNKWIGTYEGLAMFDDSNWTVFNTSNSEIPANAVYAITIDVSGNKWIGTYGGLAKFDDFNWVVYTEQNSELPGNIVRELAIDKEDNKWISAGGAFHNGLLKFDSTNWTLYNLTNSGLPGDIVSSITFDEEGNKWIGTNGGLGIYNETGIVAVKDKKPHVHNSLNKITLIIKNSSILFTLQTSGNTKLQIYNMKGRLIKTLVDSYKQAGNYEVNWDSKRFGSGIYFLKLSVNGSSVSRKVTIIR